MQADARRWGLALSGGGFRAALFNLGSLWRLNDLGWLPRLDTLSSVSGGSITNGVLASRWSELVFDSGVATNFAERVAEPLLRFCALPIDLPTWVAGVLNPLRSAAASLQREYERELFGDLLLSALPAPSAGAPCFVFYASNFQTGVSFRFTHDALCDYKLGSVAADGVRLAQAVAASSAFPPLFSPMVLHTDPKAWSRPPYGGRLPAARLAEFRRRLVLTDGGVYDNMGIEVLWKSHDVVLVSDAGKPFAEAPRPWQNLVSQLSRVRDIGMEQALALRRRSLMERFRTGRLAGTYWSIRTPLTRYRLGDAMAGDSEVARALADVPTRLDALGRPLQARLVNSGYALADAAIRRYLEPGAAKGCWPFPAYALPQG